MNEQSISASVLCAYPPVDEAQLDRLLAAEIEASDVKFIVLDDDPTGVQTVHDISVYTDWTVESMLQGFQEENKVFYILTNSRGMTAAETTKIHREILASAAEAAAETGRRYLFISRSDSTLRGHYPLETELLREGLEKTGGIGIDGEVIYPFFKEGGRFTIGNVHYVQYGDALVPAADTEFAGDRTFGYTRSAIPEYVEEKTGGRFKAADVTCISLDDLRAGAIDKITQQLMDVRNFDKVCVNSIDYCDVKTFCIALYRAMSRGKRFLFRTAAGFVKVVGGISDRPLLTREELLALDGVVPVEFHSGLVLEGDEAFYAEVARCVAEEEKIIKSGKSAVCFTERKLLALKDDSKEAALLRSVKISDGVQKLVGGLSVTPAFVVAKGGITSSDVGTKALAVKRANVLGQIRPGIPVWQTGRESKFPGTAYVIFPGNVGEASTLREAVEILMGSHEN